MFPLKIYNIKKFVAISHLFLLGAVLNKNGNISIIFDTQILIQYFNLSMECKSFTLKLDQ